MNITETKNLNYFTQSLFEQAKMLVPKEILADFAERFEKRSEFVFPILLFFYFAKKNIRKVKKEKGLVLQLCNLEMIDERKTYRLELQDHDIWMTLTFGYEVNAEASERSICSLRLYEQTPQFYYWMNKDEPTLLEASPFIVLDGIQSIETIPECALSFRKEIYQINDANHLLRLNFLTELLYAFGELRSTSKVYEVKPPLAGTELSASYEKEKVVEEVKH